MKIEQYLLQMCDWAAAAVLARLCLLAVVSAVKALLAWFSAHRPSTRLRSLSSGFQRRDISGFILALFGLASGSGIAIYPGFAPYAQFLIPGMLLAAVLCELLYSRLSNRWLKAPIALLMYASQSGLLVHLLFQYGPMLSKLTLAAVPFFSAIWVLAGALAVHLFIKAPRFRWSLALAALVLLVIGAADVLQEPLNRLTVSDAKETPAVHETALPQQVLQFSIEPGQVMTMTVSLPGSPQSKLLLRLEGAAKPDPIIIQANPEIFHEPAPSRSIDQR